MPIFPCDWVMDDILNLLIDASHLGIGSFCRSEWFSLSFKGDIKWLKLFHICWRDLYALVMSIAISEESLNGKRATVHTDNYHICVLYQQKSYSQHWLIIRVLYTLIAKLNLECHVYYINTLWNPFPNTLSKLNIGSLKKLNNQSNYDLANSYYWRRCRSINLILRMRMFLTLIRMFITSIRIISVGYAFCF